LLLSMATAAPLAGFTDPVELMRTLSPAPDVVTGVVTAVLMTCSAAAGAAGNMVKAPRAVDARRNRIDKNPLLPAPRRRAGYRLSARPRPPARHMPGERQDRCLRDGKKAAAAASVGPRERRPKTQPKVKPG